MSETENLCCVYCGNYFEHKIIDEHTIVCVQEWKQKRENLEKEIRPSTPTTPEREENVQNYNQKCLEIFHQTNTITCKTCNNKIEGFEEYLKHICQATNTTTNNVHKVPQKNRFKIYASGLIATERMKLARQAIFCIYCGQGISPTTFVTHEPLCLQRFRLERITLPHELRLPTPRVPERVSDLTNFPEQERSIYNAKVTKIYKDMTEIGCPYCERNFDGYFKMVKHMNDCKNLKMLGREATKNKFIFSAVETPKLRPSASPYHPQNTITTQSNNSNNSNVILTQSNTSNQTNSVPQIDSVTLATAEKIRNEIVCLYCSDKFLAVDLRIHQDQCIEKWKASHNGMNPPTPPTITETLESMTESQIFEYNLKCHEIQNKLTNTFECVYCGIKFQNESEFKTHSSLSNSCSRSIVNENVQISTPTPKTAATIKMHHLNNNNNNNNHNSNHSNDIVIDQKEISLVCYICGEDSTVETYISHVTECVHNWRRCRDKLPITLKISTPRQPIMSFVFEDLLSTHITNELKIQKDQYNSECSNTSNLTSVMNCPACQFPFGYPFELEKHYSNCKFDLTKSVEPIQLPTFIRPSPRVESPPKGSPQLPNKPLKSMSLTKMFKKKESKPEISKKQQQGATPVVILT